MEYHPVAGKIKNLLSAGEYWFETFEHEEVRTSEEAAKIRSGYTLHQGAKAIIVRVKISEGNKRFVMLVFPADLRFDNGKVKDFFKAKDIRFANPQEIKTVTGGVE